MAGESRKKNRSAALLEDIRSEVRRVAEGHSGLARQLEEIRKEMASRSDFLEQEVPKVLQRVWKAINSNTDRLEVLIGRFDSHERTHVAL